MYRPTGYTSGVGTWSLVGSDDATATRHPPLVTQPILPVAGMPTKSPPGAKKKSSPAGALPLPQTKKRRTAAATAAAPPPSVGDALKAELRSTQRREPAPALWEVDETAPFPRGGGSALTPLEYKAAVSAAKEDALFEVHEESSREPAAVDMEERTAMGGRELVRAHSLSRKHLVAGVRLLGAVSEVSSDRMLLQLPSRLVGRVERHEVSDELHAALADGTLQSPPDLRKLFRPGEVLCCAVLHAAASTTAAKGQAAPPIELTLRLSLVQQAALEASPRLRGGALVWGVLRSSEEYGFVMGTSQPAGGFLHRASWRAAQGAHAARVRRPHAHPCGTRARARDRHARSPLAHAATAHCGIRCACARASCAQSRPAGGRTSVQ